MKKIIILFLLFLLLTDCNRGKDNLLIINKFPQEQHLTGHTIEDITFYTKKNVNLVVLDTILAIQKREESLFNIYSTSDYRLLAKFGNIGKGPNEFIFPQLLKQTSFDESNNSPDLCVYDIAKRHFTKINILNAINNQINGIFKNLPIPDYNQYFTYFFYRDNDLMVATPEKNYRLVLYKDSTKSYQKISYLPKLNFKITDTFQRGKFSSATFVNKNLGRIVSAPFFLGEIDIFDLNGKLIKSTAFETKKDLKKSLTNFDDEKNWNPKLYIVDLQADDKYIFALNYDNYQNNFGYGKKFTNESILVFDWNGNPIKKYVLDTSYFIRYFAVDFKNKRFYGFCLEEQDHPIIVYNY